MVNRHITEAVYLMLRLVVGFLFFAHGAKKLYGMFGGTPGETVDLMSQTGIAGMLETYGGILIMVGLFTRLTAFVLAGEMAVAYFMVHAPKAVWPIENGGEAAALFCFVFLFMAAYGGGAYSLDYLLFGRARANTPRTYAGEPRTYPH